MEPRRHSQRLSSAQSCPSLGVISVLMTLCNRLQLWALNDVGEAVNHLSMMGDMLYQCCYVLQLIGILRYALMQEKDPWLFPSHQEEQGYIPGSRWMWLQMDSEFVGAQSALHTCSNPFARLSF